MAETDSEQRSFPIYAGGGQRNRYACSLRRARAWRDEDRGVFGSKRFLYGDLVTAGDANFGPGVLQIIDEREGEAVEIVDDEDSRTVQLETRPS
jgi:hypothetical protein